jgi:hypothetical protein
MNQGISFTLGQIREFVDSYKIKLLNSSPYYAQANSQAESSNKTLIKLIKQKIEENPRRWHEVYQKHYGLIVFLDIVLLKLLLLSLCMDKKPFCQ